MADEGERRRFLTERESVFSFFPPSVSSSRGLFGAFYFLFYPPSIIITRYLVQMVGRDTRQDRGRGSVCAHVDHVARGTVSFAGRRRGRGLPVDD